MSKRGWWSILPPAAVLGLWAVCFRRQYLLFGLLLAISALLPVLLRFEGSKPKAREVVLLAVLCALAVAGRAAFFFLPQVKPGCAIVIVTGICLGAERGFLTGALSALLSNFLFGQGLWTPFQMLAMGACGWLAGLLFYGRKKQPGRSGLAIFGFLAATVVHGLLVEGSSLFFIPHDSGLGGILTVYALGLPANLLHGVATAAFLAMLGHPLMRKLERIRRVYELQV